MLNQRNTRKQGDVGLGAAIAHFCREGRTVSVPLTGNQDFDLIVGDDALTRVQVKTTTRKTPYGVFSVELRTKGGNQSGVGKTKDFRDTDVDFLYVLTAEGDEYLIPSKEVSTTTLNLGDRCARWKIA